MRFEGNSDDDEGKDQNEPLATPGDGSEAGDESVFPVLPVTRLLFERRRIVYEDGSVEVQEWDGEDWVAVDDD